jgi:hypothetical protein
VRREIAYTLKLDNVYYAGMVVLRLQRQDKPHVLEVFVRVIPLLSQEPVAQRLWIVEENRIRVRE